MGRPMDAGNDAWRERATRDAVLAGDATASRAWYDIRVKPCSGGRNVSWLVAG